MSRPSLRPKTRAGFEDTTREHLVPNFGATPIGIQVNPVTAFLGTKSASVRSKLSTVYTASHGVDPSQRLRHAWVGLLRIGR